MGELLPGLLFASRDKIPAFQWTRDVSYLPFSGEATVPSVYSAVQTLHKALLGLLFLGLTLHSQLVWAQADTTDFEWSEERPLTWSDYVLKKFKSGKKEIAITSVKHRVVGYMENGVPEFEVKVVFVAKDSWTSDTTNMALLAHEQLHFDIGELYRRKIEEKIKRLQKDGEKQKAIYRYVIRKSLSDFRIFSEEYDRETKHGVLKGMQQKWQTKVWEELNRLHN